MGMRHGMFVVALSLMVAGSYPIHTLGRLTLPKR